MLQPGLQPGVRFGGCGALCELAVLLLNYPQFAPLASERPPQPFPSVFAAVGAVDVFLDFISYSTGPLPEQQLAKLTCPVRIIWGEVFDFFSQSYVVLEHFISALF